MRTQPPPDPVADESPPEGFVVVWRERGEARLATREERAERKCRRPGCKRPPVMALMRSNGWWLYCDWHTYGRRIEGGRVLSRGLRPEHDLKEAGAS